MQEKLSAIGTGPVVMSTIMQGHVASNERINNNLKTPALPVSLSLKRDSEAD